MKLLICVFIFKQFNMLYFFKINFKKILVIFMAGLLLRTFLNYVIDNNAYYDYCGVIDIVFYGGMGLFSTLVLSACSYSDMIPLASGELDSPGLKGVHFTKNRPDMHLPSRNLESRVEEIGGSGALAGLYQGNPSLNPGGPGRTHEDSLLDRFKCKLK